jgi:hypothetical protein
MEEILKGLQGKSMSKKSLFDFLSEINLEELSTDKPKNTIIYEDIVIHPIKEEQLQETKRRGRKPKKKSVIEEIPKEKKRRGRKPKESPIIEEIPKETPIIEEIPKAKKRKGRNPNHKSMIEELAKDKKADTIKLNKGIHLIINECLEKAITDTNNLQCKFCKYTFSIKGNLHKHYNTSKICNSMAYEEFKNLINNLDQ